MPCTLVITGVFDGPLSPQGLPKVVEFYATCDIPDLSVYRLAIYRDGSPTISIFFPLDPVGISEGEFYYVAKGYSDFIDWFGFIPNQTSSQANNDGNDVYALLNTADNSPVDVFGVVGTDGTDEPWEFTVGWAYRKDGTGPDGATFQLSSWTFSNTSALADPSPSTNDLASVPFPLKQYSECGRRRLRRSLQSAKPSSDEVLHSSIELSGAISSFNVTNDIQEHHPLYSLDPDFDGTFLSAILVSNFSGTSGPVTFGKEYKKGRDYNGITVGVYNVRPQQVDPVSGKRSHSTYFISIWKEGSGWEHVPGTELVYRDGSTVYAGVYRQIFNAHYISQSARVVGLGLMVIAWVMALTAMVLLGWLRKDLNIRRAQPFHLQNLCIGSIVLSTSIFTLSFDEDAGWTQHQLSMACSLAPWFFFAGHTLIFCSLFMKSWRADRALGLQSRAVALYQSFLPLAFFVVATLSILTAHSVHDSWGWQRSIISELPAETYGKCQSNHSWAFFGSLIALLFLAEATTLYFALKTIGTHRDSGDAKAVMYTCFTQIQAWVVGVPMLALIGYSSADATYFAYILLIWIFSVSGVAILVGPKIFNAIKVRRAVPGEIPLVSRRATVKSVYAEGGNGQMLVSKGFSGDFSVRSKLSSRPGGMLDSSVLKQVQEEDEGSSLQSGRD